ncbi:ATP-dependent DNA helicase RecQ [Lachnospiraceae bacterium C7]|nr:ATP-dependent DNA helicase RecQ [Lachnospiraceae bacterium C7]
MRYNIIARQLNKKIKDIKEQFSGHEKGKCLVVLKGIPLLKYRKDIEEIFEANLQDVNLEALVENRMTYLLKLNVSRQVVTYEEFLLMQNMLLEMYKEIYIIDNNLYIEQYPLSLNVSQKTSVAIKNHYVNSDSTIQNIEIDKEINDDKKQKDMEDDITEYIKIFEGVKESYSNQYIGVYCDESIKENSKIEWVKLFDTELVKDHTLLENIEKIDDIAKIVEERYKDNSNNESIYEMEILEESDYVEMVNMALYNPKVFFFRISNYVGNNMKLRAHLDILLEQCMEYTQFILVQPEKIKNEFIHRDEYTNILKKYWGYNDFRNLSVYDVSKLDDNKKEVLQVSQENIIADLVEQTENCEKKREDEKIKNQRDIFVTAPTGAGKSVMFQIPAIYLAEKYNLLTIVISPLIGLMNDQVKNLEERNYHGAKTINSDISPIFKRKIMEEVADSKLHILYISPETLLSRSDVEQLIGDRTIGMIVIDEAHIVTTWGKQFRPDYWYLGDHINKLRKNQLNKKNRSFVVATFTATAIYHGEEDMYNETMASLNMRDPIVYLGYVKRNDINIMIDNSKKDGSKRSEYEPDKFREIKELVKRSIFFEQKTLVYFPTVALIKRCYQFLEGERMIGNVARYYGTMDKDEKNENYNDFLSGKKKVMLATKAFGMGIDIDDIKVVAHFAPTGNVCDYVQEIGRAARRNDIDGEAYYHYNPLDFKHINKLHGMSKIHKYQLIEIMKKIIEIYKQNEKNRRKSSDVGKRNAMLIDAENFTYIFDSPISDESENMNKVKTALLIIQKDFEARIGFSPINVRPIPMFAMGYFRIDRASRGRLKRIYPGTLKIIDKESDICLVKLEDIWKKKYENMSFPKFKYMLYSHSSELNFNKNFKLDPALCVNISFKDDFDSIFHTIWDSVKGYIGEKIVSGEYVSVHNMAIAVKNSIGVSEYKANSLCEVIVASMDSYRKNFARESSPIVKERTTKEGFTKYQFKNAVNFYFKWVETGYKWICTHADDGELYVVDQAQKVTLVLGICEALGILTFKMIGGANSQLYIYVNQLQTMENVIKSPDKYRNRILDSVSSRHRISVAMLTFLFEGGFTSNEIWNYIEDYFLGKVPNEVIRKCRK